MPQLQGKRRAADKPRFRKLGKCLQSFEQGMRLWLYRVEE